MVKETLKISIIIPTLNRAPVLSKALESIFNQKSNIDFEIIVVDNGSIDETNKICKYWETNRAHFKYYYDSVPGLLTGRHKGAEEASGEILSFLDDDVELSDTWLKAVFETMSSRPDISLMTGPNMPRYEKDPPEWVSYFWNGTPYGGKECSCLSLLDLGNNIIEIDPIYVWGLNFSIRKSVFLELGGFHPDCIPAHLQMFQGDGETGLSLKAIEKGYKALYNPKALVYHDVPAERMTLGYFDKRYFYQGICNSYSEIRRNSGIKTRLGSADIKRKTKHFIQLLYSTIFKKNEVFIQRESNIEKEMLYTRFQAMERAGYNFHQGIVKKSPTLLKWVLKENYFDYRLPEL